MENRIISEINTWHQKVADFKQAFGNHVADYRYLVRAKPDHFKEIKEKYKQEPVNKDEKIAGKILQAEIHRLEKLAFPNPIERLIRKLFENASGAIRNLRSHTVAPTQRDLKNEVIRKTKNESQESVKNLNKEAGKYNKDAKAGENVDLLPKLRQRNVKGLNL